MKKNTASQAIGAQMINASDGSAFTGSVTVAVTGDAGTQATGSVGAGACTHEGGGYHTYAPAQAETNYDLVAFTFSGTGAIPATIQVYTTFPQTGDGFARLGAPAGASVSADVAAVKVDTAAVKVKTDFLPSATAGAAGGVFIAGSNAATSITTALTANVIGNVTGNVSGSVGSVTGAVGSVTGNVGGTVATVTNLTNAPTAGDFTATMKTSIGTAVAASAVASVTGNVGGNVTGSVGSLGAQAKLDVNAEADTALADYDAPTNAEMVARTLAAASYATASALATTDGKVDTVDTVVDAVKLKTDSLTFTTAGMVDSAIKRVGNTTLNAAGTGGQGYGA